AHVTPGEVTTPVGQVDLAPTFCEIAGVPVAEWMQGTPLPKTGVGGHDRMITEWDSQFPGMGMHLRTIFRDGFTCTVYEPSTRTDTGFEKNLEPQLRGMVGYPKTDILYDGSEGELYDHANDPHQWRNLWADPQYAKLKADLIDDLYGHMPVARQPALEVEAPT
ncbi:MAG: sulfatase family protein, partial [Gemmatimonadaceae bacterium]